MRMETDAGAVSVCAFGQLSERFKGLSPTVVITVLGSKI